MNNVHEDRPVVFQSRWALSYLPGPVSREQIQSLMANRKMGAKPQSVKPGGSAIAAAAGATARSASSAGSERPVPKAADRPVLTA